MNFNYTHNAMNNATTIKAKLCNELNLLSVDEFNKLFGSNVYITGTAAASSSDINGNDVFYVDLESNYFKCTFMITAVELDEHIDFLSESNFSQITTKPATEELNECEGGIREKLEEICSSIIKDIAGMCSRSFGYSNDTELVETQARHRAQTELTLRTSLHGDALEYLNQTQVAKLQNRIQSIALTSFLETAETEGETVFKTTVIDKDNQKLSKEIKAVWSV